MSATLTNGKPRKQLSDQLDRLDGILDALADALPDAVTDACREGARQAVKEALVEVLTHPEIRSILASAAKPSEVSGSSIWARFKIQIAALRSRVVESLGPITTAITAHSKKAVPIVATTLLSIGLLWRFRTTLLASLGVGVVTAAVSYYAPQMVAVVLSGIGGVVTTVLVQAATRIRSLISSIDRTEFAF